MWAPRPPQLPLTAVLPLILASLVACGSDSTGPGTPQIRNINNATEPASPVAGTIEINGSGFSTRPGRVDFAQGVNVAEVTPAAAGWSPTGLTVTVPAEGAEGAFDVPGTVSVTVVTEAGTSNAASLELVAIPEFAVDDVEWAATTALPMPLRGLAAAPVPNTSTSAWLIVAGGNDGTNNLAAVYSTTINQDGTLAGAWALAAPLPATRAYHALVVAHPGNSPVASGGRFAYAIAGQQAADGMPDGRSTVFVGTVALATGTISSWTTGPALPEALVGPAATIHHGHIYVVGGLRGTGAPGTAVYSAPIRENGTLGNWAPAANALPAGVAFATAFGSGGNLYVLGGQVGVSADPNDQGTGTRSVRYAPVRNGAVGAWTETAEMMKQRKKHVTWAAFGQVLTAEGVYDGSPGSLELERSTLEATGAVAPWTGIAAAASQIGAHVFNAAGVVSPVSPATGGPRFLLLGGQEFVTTPPGPLSAAVYYNSSP